MTLRATVLVILMLALTSCSFSNRDATIKSLEGRRVAIDRDADIDAGPEKIAESYRAFLNTKTPGIDPLRAEALRRLGDMEMETLEERSLNGANVEDAKAKPDARELSKSDYRNAIQLYRDLLRAYPAYPGNDRVLYQLGKAHEYAGELELALQVLDSLIVSYPATAYYDEVQFRRGEILFVKKSYNKAEQAYQTIIARGDQSLFYEKALYKHGWALFKQGRYDDGLDSFFTVLDRKLAGRDDGKPLAEMTTLSRGERELLEDTFRVVSLSFSHLDGANSVTGYFSTNGQRTYEFRVYQQLGGLYLKQERIKDAADTYNAFVRRYPNNPQSPNFQVRVIQAYKQAGFSSLVLDAKKEFVTRYGIHSDYRRQVSASIYQQQVLPHLKTNLDDLSKYYHAKAQKTKKTGDYQAAAGWYRAYLEAFPKDPQSPSMNFLLAENLFEARDYAAATEEYEATAYRYPVHKKSADAGYAALLAFAAHEKKLKGNERLAWHKRSVASALRFTNSYSQDPRTPAVLTQTAEKLYAMHSPDKAAATARRVLALQPPAPPTLRRTALMVVANTDFEQGAFDRSEEAYKQVLLLTPKGDKRRADLVERLASSVYKQGEQSRSVGDTRVAVDHFLRVGKIAPASPIRPTAEYDAAAGLIALQDWPSATQVLEHFRRSYPKHPLQGEVTNKLAASYLKGGKPAKAAVEFERLAQSNKDPVQRRAALWQAAELYEKAGSEKQAVSVYERYIKQYPSPLEPAMEGRHRVATINKKQGNKKRYYHWLGQIVVAEQKARKESTARTRTLAAQATMELAEPVYRQYRQVKLVRPLKKSLKTKKKKMELTLKAYDRAVEYGVAEVATAATYRIAEIYNDFGRALLKSQRPKGLSAEELEQYDVLLEEQAYPFEEKAIEIHETNAGRISKGIYDQWVKRSFSALGKLMPARYAKYEKSEVVIHAIR